MMDNKPRMAITMRPWLILSLVTVLALLVNLPIFLVVFNSFQSTDDILAARSLIPRNFSLVNYLYLGERTRFWTFLGNSVIVAICSTMLGMVAAVLAGYALSRFQGPLLGAYAKSLFAIQMFPIIMALIPLFVLFRSLDLINSPYAICVIYALINLPFATSMARSYFDTIPRELEEAAWIDGASDIGAFMRVVLPLSGPGLAAITIFSFLFSYNEYLIANVFLRKDDTLTLPVGIQMFMAQYSTDWGSLMAATTLTVLPTLMLFLLAQKFITPGGLSGSIKG
ncbi:carbohydrate ABC transporter permease [Verminephrobacter aporrectodeae subsp. tuberculatae]|uniref:carbohydrate ABC transporter permease n=1 Tax=Verminephrobacter aporrectodeae TaxID=1110389 RepID=UPI002243DC51|nr:carbohydrate ABC transporter permease [Verminephrobacter aporrectodeae]MCW8166741.1 carbohydrate ABC transporter permease [Verminephrobacter aporrectodeae subsp. tuberculatae]MCW8169042.1 carbohydrate ABC transporter permease [Verminephrobacter aporrectodeae subsp. tuberculatae]